MRDLEVQPDFRSPTFTTYLEGSDASGKDTLADLAISTRATIGGVACTKAGAFFLPDSLQQYEDWRKEGLVPDPIPAVLLTATVRDVAMSHYRPDELPTLQASHYAIRSAAFQQASPNPEERDLYDHFDQAAKMLPGNCIPIGLETDIAELQRRVAANPASGYFDYMVHREPERIRRLSDYINAKCLRAGGFVVETTGRTPEEIVAKIEEHVETVVEPLNRLDPADVLRTSRAILEDFRNKPLYRGIEPAVDHVLAEFDALR